MFAFDILIKEKHKRDSEALARFVYKSMPGVNTHYTFNKVLGTANYYFDKKEVSKG